MKTQLINGLNTFGLGFLSPVALLATGEKPKEQLSEIWSRIGLPILAVLIFLFLWGAGAAKVNTSLGQLPGPSATWEQAKNLHAEHREEQEKAAAFYERQEKRNEKKLAKNPDAEVKVRTYNGAPTFYQQIVTSLITVFTGFLLATIIAIPIGVACGLSSSLNNAIAPLIQILKPVSPLAWLPIVTLVVSATYTAADPTFSKSFVTSALTVTLCSLWPTLINTAAGVSRIDPDLINVGRVINLPWYRQVTKIALPASLPMIFTGLRISLGIGWMVLIAAEMLAQNPGLGKFVWDEFQNGSSNSLGRILVAVVVIGLIGFILDWMIGTLQRLISYEAEK